MDFDQPPVVRVFVDEPPPARAWPMTVPAVAQLVREGLDLPKGVTFLVGENGSGKSTLVEAVAVAFGLWHWQAYLDAPQRYLRHALGDD